MGAGDRVDQQSVLAPSLPPRRALGPLSYAWSLSRRSPGTECSHGRPRRIREKTDDQSALTFQEHPVITLVGSDFETCRDAVPAQAARRSGSRATIARDGAWCMPGPLRAAAIHPGGFSGVLSKHFGTQDCDGMICGGDG